MLDSLSKELLKPSCDIPKVWAALM
jgi:hypothetical protein